MYSVRGVGTASTTLGNAIFAFWNPHASQIVKLRRIVVSQQAGQSAGSTGVFRRTSTRGTPGSTVTPNISTDGKRGVDPPSGVLLDLGAFSVEPTKDTDELGLIYAQMGGVSGGDGDFSLYEFPGEGLYIPPGTGLCFVKTTINAAGPYEIGLTWSEDA